MVQTTFQYVYAREATSDEVLLTTATRECLVNAGYDITDHYFACASVDETSTQSSGGADQMSSAIQQISQTCETLPVDAALAVVCTDRTVHVIKVHGLRWTHDTTPPRVVIKTISGRA